jgi:single-strand DNA-binding protein
MNINRVLLTANLTRDPDLRTLASGSSVCNLRVAVNSRMKRDGEWTEKPNYFDVSVFGAQAESCKRFLVKGRMVAIDGRLDWREWEQDGAKRQSVSIIADTVQFLSDGQPHERSAVRETAPPTPVSAPAGDSVFGGPIADEDIPF